MDAVKRGDMETAQLEEDSARFDNELQQQIDGTLPKNHVYQMGRPGPILRSTGIPDLPIQLAASRLAEKSLDTYHPFEIADVKGIVKALQAPVAIFSYGDRTKAQNIIVEISSNGKNFLVGMSLNPEVGGRVLSVNSIRNVFPKDTAEWLNWIAQGKLLYADKQKVQDLIDQQRINLADVAYLDLNRVSSILNSFVNPQAESSQESEGSGGIVNFDTPKLDPGRRAEEMNTYAKRYVARHRALRALNNPKPVAIRMVMKCCGNLPEGRSEYHPIRRNPSCRSP